MSLCLYWPATGEPFIAQLLSKETDANRIAVDGNIKRVPTERVFDLAMLARVLLINISPLVGNA